MLSGDLSGTGNIDDVGSQARFNAPQGIASDAAGNVYVADTENATIRKISSTGDVSTLAGTPGVTGQLDGQSAAARFKRPVGIVSDAGGTLWVTDGNRVRKITPSGAVSTLINTGDSFIGLGGLARDASGQLYAVKDRSVLKITAQGAVSTFADLTAAVPGYQSFSGIAVDALGNAYITSVSTHSVLKVTPAGTVSIFAGVPSTTGGVSTTVGAAVTALFAPDGIAINTQGNVVVADGSDYVRTINPAGTLVSMLQFPPKGGGLGGISRGVTIDGSGRTMVLWKDAVYTPDVNQVLAEYAGHNSANASSSAYAYPSDYPNPWIRALGTNSAGGISFLERTQTPDGLLRSASSNGVLTTIGPRKLQNTFYGLEAIRPNGDIYVSDRVIQEVSFRRFETGGSVEKLSTTGDRAAVWSSDSQVPERMQFDALGNLHLQYRPVTYSILSDFYLPQQYTIAKIDGGNSVINSLALPYQGRGPARPRIAFAVDPAGGYFVGDSHAMFKVSAAGQLSFLAGNVDTPGAADGTGSAARFNDIASLAVDGAGNVLVADKQNHAIRKVTPAGVVTTVVGQLGKVRASEGALPGTLWLPDKLVVDASGVLYVGSGYALLRVQFP